jgi:ketosteroid isomerase-like protein
VTASIRDLEEAVLRAMVDGDRPSLERLLTEDFVITTAGWLTAPATRTHWLDALAPHSLRTFDIESVDERHLGGDVTVALVLSRQSGELAGRHFDLSFRYTDVWVAGPNGASRLAVRHASIVQDPV